MTIHTTLYDLSAALSAEVGPDEEDVLTAAFMHLLNTHRVTCTGNLKGYRLRACNARGIQPYTAMVLGKAGALDDLMTHTQALHLRLPWHRNVAYVDPRVLGMRVPLGSKASFPDAGACPADA